MKENVKKAIITTLTLGGIVLGAGVIIGVTSAITSPFVYEHSLAARLKAVQGVFPEADDVSEPESIEANGLVERYTVSQGDVLLGWAYAANGQSVSDTVDLMIGVNADLSLGRIETTDSSTISDYMNNAVTGYLDKVNEGDIDYEDVPTGIGGTETAKTMKRLIDAALAHAKANAGGDTVSEELKFVRNVFPEADDVSEPVEIALVDPNGTWHLDARYEVNGEGGLIGYAYQGGVESMSQYGNILLGILPDGTLSRIHAYSFSMDDHDGMYMPSWITDVYVPEINSGDRDPSATGANEDPVLGATMTANAIYGAIQAAEADVASLGGE